MRLIVEHNLDVISRKHDVHHSNYTHCSRVLHSMNNLLFKISTHNIAAQQTEKATFTTVTNNPIMASSSTPLSPLAAAFSKITVAKSLPDNNDTNIPPISNTAVSSYTDSALSRYAANAHIEKEDLRLSDSCAGQSLLDETLQSSSSDENQNHSVPPVAGERHGSFVTENEMRQREVREEQFIRDHLGDVFVEIEPYNHSHCSDCTCVYSMANECLMHLAASQHQSQECASRIRRLVGEFKERVKVDAERLDALDWGGHNHVNLA